MHARHLRVPCGRRGPGGAAWLQSCAPTRRAAHLQGAGGRCVPAAACRTSSSSAASSPAPPRSEHSKPASWMAATSWACGRRRPDRWASSREQGWGAGQGAGKQRAHGRARRLLRCPVALSPPDHAAGLHQRAHTPAHLVRLGGIVLDPALSQGERHRRVPHAGRRRQGSLHRAAARGAGHTADAQPAGGCWGEDGPACGERCARSGRRDESAGAGAHSSLESRSHLARCSDGAAWAPPSTSRAAACGACGQRDQACGMAGGSRLEAPARVASGRAPTLPPPLGPDR